MFILNHIIPFVSASGGGTSGGSFSDITTAGTNLVTWLITTMTSFLSFITANDILMVFFILSIVSFAAGLILRFWKQSGR